MTGVAGWRRLGVIVALVSLVAGATGLVAARAQSSSPEVNLYEPERNHERAFRAGQRVSFDGQVDPAQSDSFALFYDMYDASDNRICAKDISPRVNMQADGTFSGDYATNHFCRPDPDSDPIDPADVARVRLRAAVPGASGESEPLRVDHDDPRIRTSRLVTPTRVVVEFTEPVWHVNNDTGEEVDGNPTDWRVDPGSEPGETCCSSQAQVPTDVTGSGAERTLELAQPLDEDATPRVFFRNPDQPTTGALTIYEDAVQNQLLVEGRDHRALDRVPPAEPHVEAVAGDDTASDGEARGGDPTPDVVVGNVREGHSVQIRLDNPQGQRLAEGTVPEGEDEITLTTSDLGDTGTYTLVARAIDPHGNARSEGEPPAYHLDLDAPFAVSAEPDDREIVVTFSEPVDGTDAADQWELSGEHDIVDVQPVDGFSDQRTLEVSGDVTPGTLLSWTPPDQNAYHDDVGNEVDAFTLEVGAGVPPPPPLIDAINGKDASDGRVVDNVSAPIVHVTDIAAGHLAEVYEDRGDGSDKLGEEEADDDGADVQLPDLGDDGTYFFHAAAVDGQANTTHGDQQVSYRLDTVAPEPFAAIADGRELTVHFNEEIDGTDASEHWQILGCVSLTCPEVVAVAGEGRTRTLTTSEPAREDWLLVYAPSTGERYHDEAGNEVDNFEQLISGELPPLVSISGPSRVAEGHSGTRAATYTISLAAASEKPVAVQWETRQGTADGGQDYESNSGLVAFLPGETAKQVTVQVIGDERHEPDETFSVALVTSLGEPIDPDGAVVETTIVDDDPPPLVSLDGDVEVAEGNGGHTPAELTVSLDRVSERRTTVDWATVEGTAIAGEDFVAASGRLAFDPGETETTVRVQVVGDIVGEYDETFDVTLSDPDNASLGDATATVTIRNDDPPAVRVHDVRTTEPDGVDVRRVHVPVTMTPDWDEDVTLSWETVEGSATAGEDFRAASGEVTVPAGATSATIPVVVLADDEPEPTESFTVEVTDADRARVFDAVAEVTIVDSTEVTQSVDTRACAPAKVPDPGFEDIDDRFHAANIACIAWYGITIGVGDTDGNSRDEYAPDEFVTRGQMASFIVRLAGETGMSIPRDPPDAFEDDTDSVHHDAINALAALDIVKGRHDRDDVDGDGDRDELVYAPRDFVTRAQMASFMARLAEAAGASLPDDPPDAFDDDTGSVHHDAINALAAVGIVEGRQDSGDADRDGDTSEHLYFPSESVFRAQMAAFLGRVLDLFVSSGIAYPGGAQVTLDETRFAPGDRVRGSVLSHKTLRTVHVAGCDVDEDLAVGSNRRFAFTVPEDRPDGECDLDFTVTTRSDTARQTVIHVRTIAVVQDDESG